MEKVILMTAIAVATMTSCNQTNEQPDIPAEKGELSLYNNQKTSGAYIDYDDSATIYLWDGTPAAYLELHDGKDADAENEVYGFNGEFLGWYCYGVMWDKNGDAVGAKKGVVRGTDIDMTSVIDTPKGVERITPVKSTQKIGAAKPEWSDYWSETSLTDFLKNGIKE